MATADQIAALRRAVNIMSTVAPYTDAFMSALIDQEGNVASAAAVIWREKAAAYASSVDMTESGSSRKFSDLHKNALELAAAYEAESSQVVSQTGGSYVVQIERP